jgi:trimeric autotransporter adhesin
MSQTRRTILAWTAAAGAVTLLPSSRAEDDGAVGAVNDIVNFAWGTPPGEAREEIEHEDPTYMQELVETGPDSALLIVFADGSKLTLGENSECVIDEFVYDPGANTGTQAIKLTKGAFRYVSGALPKDKVKIETPPATLGIRGTELVIDITPEGDVEASTESGEAIWRPKGEDAEEIVEAGFVLQIGRDGRRRGRKQRRRMLIRSIAIAEGLESARARWPLRKPKRRRAMRRMRKIRFGGPNPDGGPNRPGPQR